MKSNFDKLCCVTLTIVLVLFRCHALKFKRDIPNFDQKPSQINSKLKETQIRFNEQSQLLSAVPNFYDALVINYKGRNINHRTLSPKIIYEKPSVSNISPNSKATSNIASNQSRNQIPQNQNNLNAPKVSSAKATKYETPVQSFIDIEDHHLLMNEDYEDLSNNQAVELNDNVIEDLEDLHLNSN
jgi:hypothetical protein